jgi:hypothetical protein
MLDLETMFDLETIRWGIATIATLALLLVAIRTLRHRRETKAREIRIKLFEGLNNLELVCRGMEEFLDGANNSRKAIMAAMGQWNGGAGQIWRKQFDEDREALRRLLATAPRNMGGYEKFSLLEFESQLILVHRFIGDFANLRQKYQRCLDEDERLRQARQAQRFR